MSRVIYMMNVSLDGFVEGPDGTFGWTRPDEEVHRFYNDLTRELGAEVYGRRMYETMKVWQTMDRDPSLPDFVQEYARIWNEKPKVVFSRTLDRVGEGFRLARGDIPAELADLRQRSGGDISVGGPGIASSFARLDLIDEYRLVVFPVIVGAGKPFFPRLERELPLRHLESRRFSCGALYLRYERVRDR